MEKCHHVCAHHPMLFWFIGALIIWELVWKALAMWKAARQGHKLWYVLLIVLNTAGILPMAYLFYFSRQKTD